MAQNTKAVLGPVQSSVRPLAWTDARCKELDELGTLLREVAAINHGSNCLERIQRCIALAEKLDRDDLSKCRDSLHNFLRGLAIADRSALERLRDVCEPNVRANRGTTA
jgi:hypothetical protein